MITPQQIAELRDISREQIEYSWKIGRVTGAERQARILLALLGEHELLQGVAEAAEALCGDLGLVDHAPLVLALRKARGAK